MGTGHRGTQGTQDTGDVPYLTTIVITPRDIPVARSI
ncbi:hypothetical protein SPSPH_038480 [Sporomusa sphaeroides DSM 2875]|uniref:Uncharacterized protein n=1 Tax=Sporomusa sphaeroides DSM 2875 TaxID=1337886 RepID=A0ABM9WAC5_9FIRM|nr:hypothetical protein SPSPH_41830 [Sporomusa sphaeroides DSM 2875]CVK21832.1 hypothetical protein SSPH_04550 [Sporomusa sphaeroides DSM 2875]